MWVLTLYDKTEIVGSIVTASEKACYKIASVIILYVENATHFVCSIAL
jgi:hypothetical protein